MSIPVMSIALLFLIAFSAFFSSSETAFLSIPKIRIRQMQKEKKPKSKLVVKLKTRIDILLTVILIGNNFVNALASSLATALAISLFGNQGTGIATIAMTIIIIIFGEILPKTIASYKSESVASRFATPLSILEKILFPLVFIFSKFTHAVKLLSKGFSSHGSSQITEEELKTLFDLGGQEGTLDLHEKDMLHKIFEFSDLRAKDIERSRTLVKMINIDATYTDAIHLAAESGFSRLPVYENDTENIVGILHFKDVLFYNESEKDFSVKKLCKKPLFIPETKDALGVLHLFKSEKQNFAIVIDEHGSFSGIITMDDLVRAVFGRATEGYDKKIRPAEDRITIINPTEFNVPGDIEIEEINNIFKMNLSSEDSDTFGGWLLEAFGYLPEEGESIQKGTILYTVLSQNNRRIKTIKMRVIANYL